MADDIESFRVELAALINRHSRENRCDTPDFILADYLCHCLITFENSVNARQAFYRDNPQAHSPQDVKER